jgi:hypothetical protein
MWARRVFWSAVLGAGLYVGVVSARITLDLGVGRRRQALGPLEVDIAAGREIVFDVIAAPYLGRTPKAMADKLRVIERGSDLVLAEHRTPVRPGIPAVTLETVRFVRPERIEFRLVRGPVPAVTETFDLTDDAGGTRLRYTGALETDLWGLGERWGRIVARRWVAAVETSLRGISAEAERLAAVRRGHGDATDS